MALRHQLALGSLEVNNIFNLCEMLKAAAQDAVAENMFPHKCPACKIIAHQIAFSCNGDAAFLHPYWDEAVAYCKKMVELDNQGATTKEKPDGPIHLPS